MLGVDVVFDDGHININNGNYGDPATQVPNRGVSGGGRMLTDAILQNQRENNSWNESM